MHLASRRNEARRIALPLDDGVDPRLRGDKPAWRWPPRERPISGASLLLLRPPRVDARIVAIGLHGQRFAYTLPNARPSAHRRKRWNWLFRLAEFGRKIAPWRSCPRDPKHRVDEQAIVFARSALVTVFTRNTLFHARGPRPIACP